MTDKFHLLINREKNTKKIIVPAFFTYGKINTTSSYIFHFKISIEFIDFYTRKYLRKICYTVNNAKSFY